MPRALSNNTETDKNDKNRDQDIPTNFNELKSDVEAKDDKPSAPAPNPTHTTALPESLEDLIEIIPGSLHEEVSLLPRILERLQFAEFVENTTLFELYAIANILRRLEQCPVIKNTEYEKIVKAVKKLFTLNLKHYFVQARREAANTAADNATTASSTLLDNDSFIIQSLVDLLGKGAVSQYPPLASSTTTNGDKKEGGDEEAMMPPITPLLSHLTAPQRFDRLRLVSKDPQRAMLDVPLRLTGMRSENESSGEGIVHYTIFSLEESGYGIDDTVTGPLLTSEQSYREQAKKDNKRSNNKAIPPTPTPTPPPGVKAEGIRLAFLVGPRGTVEEVGHESHDTSLAELAMLQQVLSSDRYGFTCVPIVSNDLGAEELEDVIVDTIAEHLGTNDDDDDNHGDDDDMTTTDRPFISQVLVYLHTPNVPRIHPVSGMPYPQYSISFPLADGSALSHRSIINAIDAACVADGDHSHPSAVGHVVVVHDVGASLQMLAAIRASPDAASLTIGSHVAVTLTEAARSVVNCSRTWLYDGLFTPLVCEMLTVARDDEERTQQRICICPEDFVNYCTIVMSFKGDEEEDDEDDQKSDDDEANAPQTKPHRLPHTGRSVIPNDATLSSAFI